MYDVTYKELTNFYDKEINELNTEQKVNLLGLYRDNNNLIKLKKDILNLFPNFPGQRLEIDFINPEKTMAVITVYRNDEIVSYFAYNNEMGVLGQYFNSFDQAVLGCIVQKYLGSSSFSNPSSLIAKMLGMKNTIKKPEKENNKDSEKEEGE